MVLSRPTSRHESTSSLRVRMAGDVLESAEDPADTLLLQERQISKEPQAHCGKWS